MTGDVISDREMMTRLAAPRYDLVLANIVADVIIPLAPLAPHFLKPGGRFICSGILDRRLPEVQDALDAAGFEVLTLRTKDDWCQITARLPQEV